MLTKVFNVPSHEVARVICEVIATANPKYLKEVHLVDIVDDTLSLIGGTFLQSCRQGSPNASDDVIELDHEVIFSTIQRRLTIKTHDPSIYDGVKVFISYGDIINLKADAIVCANDNKLSCSSGVAKKIANLVGGEYKEQCRQTAKDMNLHSSDVVTIKTKQFGSIINVVVPSLTRLSKTLTKSQINSYKKLLTAVFENAFEEARTFDVSCLAISPLGAGKYSLRLSELYETEEVLICFT